MHHEVRLGAQLFVLYCTLFKTHIIKGGGGPSESLKYQITTTRCYVYFMELFVHHNTFYFAELFRTAMFYLAEMFHHATFYLAELFRQIAFPNDKAFIKRLPKSR